MRPLLINPRAGASAAQFHREVFAVFGGPKKLCVFCGKPNATDAAHVIKRSHLGPLRYCDPRLARPAHRACHEKQERNEISFTLETRRDAALAVNLYAKVPYPVPTE